MDDRLVKTIDQTMSLDEMQKIKIRVSVKFQAPTKGWSSMGKYS